MRIKKTPQDKLVYHKDWNNKNGAKHNRWHARWPGDWTLNSVFQRINWKSNQFHQWNEMSTSGIMSKAIYFYNNCSHFKILKCIVAFILVKKILALYYLYNVLFLDSMSISVLLAGLQEYLPFWHPQFSNYFLKVMIVNMIVLWLVNICQFLKTRSLLCYAFISEEAMPNQSCLLMYSMSTDTLSSFQVNFMLDKT